MKVSISYPPLESKKGVPLLSQNRQFQWFNNPTYVYPMIPAYAATLLTNAGHEVIWDDAIAEEKTYGQWLDEVEKEGSELMLMETKTPVVKAHWKIISNVKEVSPDTRVALAGDHVTALPEESFKNSMIDYVITGGDYDFLLLNLVEWMEGKQELEPGIWYRKGGKITSNGDFQTNHDLNSLPFIDRELTKWWLYSEKNGNFSRTPGTYTMVGRDCWWHSCTFCAWTILYPSFRVRKPESLVDEIGILIEKYGVKEIFDDTGTFPVGHWNRRFCKLLIERGYAEKVKLGCNMRFGALGFEDYKLMKKAGFRLLLYGVESANQNTLCKINKNLTVKRISEECRWASQTGLEPHLTIMVGYPWETREDMMRTTELAKQLFRKGYARTLQATIVIPYPGTPLFEECKEKDLLLTEDWDEYDMKNAVIETPMSQKELKEIVQTLYKCFLEPRYVARRLISIRSIDDLKFMKRGIAKLHGHLKDFR